MAGAQAAACLNHAWRFTPFNRDAQLQTILNQQGLALAPTNFAVVCANTAANWALVQQGLGIGVMIEEVAARDASVVPVLDALEFPAVQCWLVTQRELQTNVRVRRVFDFFCETLG